MLTCIRSYNAILFEMLWVKEYRIFFCKASECYYSSVKSDNCFFTLSKEVDPSDFFCLYAVHNIDCRIYVLVKGI